MLALYLSAGVDDFKNIGLEIISWIDQSMCMNAQTLEILGWLFITLYLTLPEMFRLLRNRYLIFHILPKKEHRIEITLSSLYISVLFGTRFGGFSIGALLLCCSRDYGYYAFSFLIVWMVMSLIQKKILKSNQPPLIIVYLIPVPFIVLLYLFAKHFQTEIWFITATLFAFVTFLELITFTIAFLEVQTAAPPMKRYSDSDLAEFRTNFYPALIIPFISILYVFDIGILDTETLHTFYGTLIGGFFALLGIVAMFGVFILRVKRNEGNLYGLFKGLILLYIIAILTLSLGLITLPKGSENEINIDLSHNSLIPDRPLEERQLSDNGQIVGKILFTVAIAFLISSLAYLYKITSRLLEATLRSDTEQGC